VSTATATYCGYVAIALALLGLELVRTHRRGVTIGRLAGWVMRGRLGWFAVLLGWAWLGWHLFVRGSGPFLR
jgi:hypothetical protein